MDIWVVVWYVEVECNEGGQEEDWAGDETDVEASVVGLLVVTGQFSLLRKLVDLVDCLEQVMSD